MKTISINKKMHNCQLPFKSHIIIMALHVMPPNDETKFYFFAVQYSRIIRYQSGPDSGVFGPPRKQKGVRVHDTRRTGRCYRSGSADLNLRPAPLGTRTSRTVKHIFYGIMC